MQVGQPGKRVEAVECLGQLQVGERVRRRVTVPALHEQADRDDLARLRVAPRDEETSLRRLGGGHWPIVRVG